MRHPWLRVLFLLLPLALYADDGARYLIFCRDDFIPAVSRLAEWKHATGVSTRVVPLSQLGVDTAAVHQYIINAWNSWPTRPEYVLIVADAAYLRSKIYGSGPDRYYSDAYYGDVTGDFVCELAVGRFPARTLDQCQVMVEKTMAYLKPPVPDDSLWMRRLTTIVREDYDADDTIYWNNVRQAARLAGEAGFVACDSLSLSRGDDAGDVLASVDSGTGIVLYRGRGTNNWYSPFAVEPAYTANGTRLPIILSMTCETMALDPYDSMVGEAWVRATGYPGPNGAVAFVGNTHSDVSVAAIRGAVTRGFFAGLFTEDEYRLGKTVLRAKLQIYWEYPQAVADYRGFNLYGDPELPIWTATPKQLVVEHPDSIPPGPRDLEVTVSHDGAPVAGAVVCATMDTTVCSVATTGLSGQATLHVEPADTGRLRLVVSGHNLLPCDTVIRVANQSGLQSGHARAARPASLVARPSVFSSHTTLLLPGPVEPGSHVAIHDAGGRLVRELSCPSAGNVVWDGNDASGQAVRPGVYVCILASGGSVRSGARVTRLP